MSGAILIPVRDLSGATWSDRLPEIMDSLERGSGKARCLAREQLRQIADIADRAKAEAR